MPLHHGSSKATFQKNLRELFRSNDKRKKKRSRRQILAIAFAEARRSLHGKRPKWLRATHRRTR